MKMSANENESVDIRLYANRRSNLIDLEELNRMERPSRVFSSRHHLSMPPVLTDTNNMEQNEQYRRSRDYTTYFENLSSSTRIGGSTANGDAARNRSPFVRFTITDPETQQITAAGQIPLNNTPPNTQTSNSLTSNNEVADVSINEESDDEPLNLNYWRNNIDPRPTYYSSMSHAIHQLRNSRSGRRSRRFTDHPYFIRNNLDNNPSNNRTIHRRVRFSSTNRGYNDHPPDRSQTPEQELPEVLEHVMEPDNQYDEVYHGQESISSVSSHNDADSGDDRGSSHFSASENHNTNADEENRDGTLDVSNETPRTRVVPFIMSPTPFSPPPESPPDTPEIPATSINDTTLVDASGTLIIIDNDDNRNTIFSNHGSILPLTDYTIPGPSQFRRVVHSDILNNDNGSVSRTIDVDLNNTENESVNNSVIIDEIVDFINEDNSETISRIPHPTLTCAMHSNNQSRAAVEETAPVRVGEHPETYVDLNDQLTRLFECPVCFEHIIPPIFQCLLGHLICNKCVLMCENCPTCRNPFNSKRNLYMEKVGYLVKFPCRNALTGCKQQLFVGQKQVHETECCYRHYQCFFTNCAWKGYYPELHAHMINNHNNCILTGSEQSLDIMLPNNNQTYKWFLLSHAEYFAVIAHSSVPPRRVKIQVNFIGPAAKAKQFTFSIQLTQHKERFSDVSQKLVYERSTLPYSEIYEMSNNNGLKKDIFSLPGEVLEPFIKKRRRRLPIVLKVAPESCL